MKNIVYRTKKKLIVKELDPSTDLMKIFHHTQANSKNFFPGQRCQKHKDGEIFVHRIRSLSYCYVKR